MVVGCLCPLAQISCVRSFGETRTCRANGVLSEYDQDRVCMSHRLREIDEPHDP